MALEERHSSATERKRAALEAFYAGTSERERGLWAVMQDAQLPVAVTSVDGSYAYPCIVPLAQPSRFD